MKLGNVNLIPYTYDIKECILDGESYEDGEIYFFLAEDGNYHAHLSMKGMKFNTFEHTLEDLLSKINEHVNFGEIKSHIDYNLKDYLV